MKYLGTIYIKQTDKIHVTDPCYDNDTWCRVHLDDFKEGVYDVYTYCKDKRIAKVQIIHRDMKDYHKQNTNQIKIDSVGVDSGLCGIFIDKPNYNTEEWVDICTYLETLEYPNQLLTRVDTPFKCTGVVTSSGYGDGLYTAAIEVDSEGLIYFCEVKYV